MTCHDEDCRSARIWAADRIAKLEAERDEARAEVIEQAGAIVARSQCKMSVEHPVVTHRHAPIAQYAFKYVPIEVTCGECGAQFPLTELKSDASDDAYSDRVCPQCEAWDCCEVTYERMTEEMAREALNGRNT